MSTFRAQEQQDAQSSDPTAMGTSSRDRARERKRRLRADACAEQKEKEKALDRTRKRLCLQEEASDHREARLYDLQERAQQKHSAESADQRVRRLQALRHHAQDRYSGEPPHQTLQRHQDLRQRAQARRAAESAEEAEERCQTLRQHAQERRAAESPEETAERCQDLRQRAQERRAAESAEEAAGRCQALRQHAQERRAAESAEEAEERCQALRQHAQERRAAESAEKAEERCQALRQHAQERRAAESAEEAEERCQALRQHAHERRTAESAEETAERCRDLRQQAQKRRASESAEEAEERCQALRQHAQECRTAESAEETAERCRDLRQQAQKCRAAESPVQTECRLASARASSSHRRQQCQDQRQTMQITKHAYLHEDGWSESQEPLHQQHWAKEEMLSFHKKQNLWEHRLCTVCHELWPTRTCLRDSPDMYICTRCKRDKHPIKTFSAANDMDPGRVPPGLEQLSQVEEMLIARACPIMSVYRKHGGQRGYKGHVLNMPQDVQGFLDRLPCHVAQLPILIIRRHGSDSTFAEFRVRRDKVMTALQWLKLNNPYYKDITIDHAALQTLPDDGVPPELLTIEETGEEEAADDDDSESRHSGDSHSFLPLPRVEHTEDSAIRSTVNDIDPMDWPDLGRHPINEFRTAGLATQAFPTLFPYGTGDPTCPGRQHEVSLTEGFKHLIKYGEETPVGNLHWRFASHPRFPYWALNMKLRHQLISQAKVYLHQNPGDANLTVEDLKAMVGSSTSEQLMKRLQRYAAKILGSNQYWFQRHQELRALLDQKGPPTFFWTVSSADTYWPELHKLMLHPSGAHPTHQMQVQAVIDNPHITDWYFSSKLSDWISHWLYNTLDAEWHWCRYEYQARGSTHAHGCAKLRNDPGVCTLVEKAAAAWLLVNSHEDADEQNQQDVDRIVAEGQIAEAAALEYADWLVCTMNDAMPDEMWRAPVPHPCAVSVHDIADASDQDYQSIVNSVQRHTRCSAAYCLRKKAGQQEQTCRFNYPRPQQLASSLQFEKLPDGTIRAVLTTRRNDPRVNSHNRLMIQHWRANVDLQMIVDVEACARYMAKYASKGEPRSQPLSSIFKSSVDRLIDDSDARTALRSAMVRSIGERDFSAQETAHQLLSLPLVSCTFSFVALSLDGGRQLSKNKQSGEQVLELSLLDHYATRSGLPDVNLIQFVSTYSVYRGEVQKRPSPVIVRAFPQYSSNPCGDRYGRYCKYQLVKYKPWIGNLSNAWGGAPDTDASCIEAYHTFLRLPAAAECVPHFSQELDRAQQHVAEDASSDSENEEPPRSEEHDEWMLLCQLNPCYTENTTTHDSVDWAGAARTLPPEILRECPSWVSKKRQQTSDTPLSPWHRHLPPVNTSTLNTQQRTAYDIVCHHHQQFLTDRNPLPLHMIVCGTAGTGKSYLISAIAHALGSTCLLTGTTGMAAYNICGKTVHSALQLPVRTSYRDLQGSSLHRLQLAMKNVSYIIIDEMSMIGQRMLAWIDKRLRQATGQLDTPLGGLSLILFGDFAQLPPVGDSPLYSNSPKGSLQVHGHTIYQLFTTIVILEQSLRQAGLDPDAIAFRSLLLRLRDGTVNQRDWQMLLARAPETATNSKEFTDAVRLYYDKASVAEYNLHKLQRIGTPIARINAIHSDSVASSATPEDAGGLHPVLLLATQSSVMLTANIWQEVGLCNGASGTIQHFLYNADHRPPDLPTAILVEFANYSGPPFLSDHPHWIPIPPLTFEWESNGRRLSRQQFPLQLRYAITIHKSQGQTLDMAVIDIGKQELAAGCTFVALSRLRSLNHGLLHPMSFRRLQAIATGKRFAERLQEETRFKLLASQAAPDSRLH